MTGKKPIANNRNFPAQSNRKKVREAALARVANLHQHGRAVKTPLQIKAHKEYLKRKLELKPSERHHKRKKIV
jgi:hypothetical protein